MGYKVGDKVRVKENLLVEDVEKFRKVVNELADLYERKNNDYGNSTKKTFDKLGAVSIATRLNDKLNRFEQLAVFNKEQKVNDESIVDTLLDMASYAIQGAILIKEKGE